MTGDRQNQAHVVVVGCGIAGLSAAVAAQEQGVSVIVLERAPIEERGGNTRHTGAYFRMRSETEVTTDFVEHFANNSGGPLDPSLLHLTAESSENWPGILRAMSFVDPEVVSTFADEAPVAISWLKKFGIRVAPLDVPFGLSAAQPRMMFVGGGAALVEALAAHFVAKGGRIDYEVAARELIVNDDGRVVGVRAVTNRNKPVEYYAQGVVLASGGFQGNAAMMTRYLGSKAVHLRMMSKGCHYNKGEGINMALDIGAAPCGDFGSWHASPMDPRSNRAGPSIYIYPYGILVNKLGVRFVDEAAGPTDENYEEVSRTIVSQPGGIAYAIYDAKVALVPNIHVTVRSEHPPVEGQTLAELANKLGISADTLEATVAGYNAACVDGEFSPLAPDGLATKRLTPPKSNWARGIDTAPFRAYPIISSVVFTFGGLKVNRDAQVVNTEGDRIPGLYAAGETMGLYYGVYTGGTSVLKGAVFGRLAGTDAARQAMSNR